MKGEPGAFGDDSHVGRLLPEGIERDDLHRALRALGFRWVSGQTRVYERGQSPIPQGPPLSVEVTVGEAALTARCTAGDAGGGADALGALLDEVLERADSESLTEPGDDVLVEDWVAYQRAPEGSDARKPLFWAVYRAMMLEPERAWSVILAILAADQSDEVMGILAAGPLEELLSEHGPTFIDRVEQRAADDPLFKDLLGGVWRLGMTEEVWDRLQAARGPVW